MRRLFCLVSLAAAVSLSASVLGVVPSPGTVASAASGRGSEPPNVLLITADDMRADDLRFMPFTRGEFRRRAVTFSDAVSPYPLCCPARAQIVTGQYNHNNGVQSNVWPTGGYWALSDPDNTLPVWLQKHGYLTGFVGKYMNQLEKDPASFVDPRGLLAGREPFEIPPGWTHWMASVGHIYHYAKVRLNVDTPATDPHRVLVREYQTDYFNRQTKRLIRKYHHRDKPFFIWASHLAPHVASRSHEWQPPYPASEDVGFHRRTPLPPRAAFHEALNAPSVHAEGPLAGRPRVRRHRVLRLHRARAESLRSLDRAVRDAVAELKRTGEYAHTTIVFTSDNGYLLGELRLTGKDMPYEPALRVPMIVNAPGLKKRYGGTSEQRRFTVPQTVTITDLASTVVGITGASPGRPLDGLDITRPEQNPETNGGDRAVLIQSGVRGPLQRREYKFVGVRTNRWTWFSWDVLALPTGPETAAVEHYDRRRQPAQTTSLAPDWGHGPRLRELALDMLDCLGEECVRTFPPGP